MGQHEVVDIGPWILLHDDYRNDAILFHYAGAKAKICGVVYTIRDGWWTEKRWWQSHSNLKEGNSGLRTEEPRETRHKTSIFTFDQDKETTLWVPRKMVAQMTPFTDEEKSGLVSYEHIVSTMVHLFVRRWWWRRQAWCIDRQRPSTTVSNDREQQ